MKLINGDCLYELKNISSGSIDLVLIDPPYNIGKAEWDEIDNYIEWMGEVFVEIDRVLKKNGSFYFFHNQFLTIIELHKCIEEKTELQFKNLITWFKVSEDFDNYGFAKQRMSVNAMRKYYEGFTEYCLFYTKVNDRGFTTKTIGENNHPTLRQYFKDILDYKSINKTAVIKIIGQEADHCFRWSSSQWDKPTQETYCKIVNELDLSDWDGLKSYEWISEMFNKERYVFNVANVNKTGLYSNGDVWLHPPAEKCGHTTPKPILLLENIIEHSSNEDDVVLDCFMGSGSTGIAAKKLNRRFIGIELNREYFNIAQDRIEGVK